MTLWLFFTCQNFMNLIVNKTNLDIVGLKKNCHLFLLNFILIMDDASETKPLLQNEKVRRGPRIGTFLPLSVKGEILKKLKNGVKPLDLAREYNIAASTISRLKKQRKSIKKAISTYRNDTERRSLRGTFHPKMESALHKWYLQETINGISVTTNALRVKARELYTQIRENNLTFQASAGWVEKFKKRYGIRLKGGYKKKLPKCEESDSDSMDADANGEQEIENGFLSDVKNEDPLIEDPAFVEVSATSMFTNVKVEQSECSGIAHDITQCMDEVIQWTTDNKIEPLYLMMLRSLRERILKSNHNK